LRHTPIESPAIAERGEYHPRVAEDRTARKRRDHLADHAEVRQDHHVDFGWPKTRTSAGRGSGCRRRPGRTHCPPEMAVDEEQAAACRSSEGNAMKTKSDRCDHLPGEDRNRHIDPGASRPKKHRCAADERRVTKFHRTAAIEAPTRCARRTTITCLCPGASRKSFNNLRYVVR